MQIKLEWLELGSGSSRYSNCLLALQTNDKQPRVNVT